MSTPMNAGQLVADVKLNLAEFDRGIDRIEVEKRRLGTGWSSRGAFDPLLADVRRARAEAEALNRELAGGGGGTAVAENRLRNVALRATGAGIAMHLLGTNLRELGDADSAAGRAGGFLSNITSGNIAGAVKAAGAETKLTADQIKFAAEQTNAHATAAKLAAIGLEDQADAVRKLRAEYVGLRDVQAQIAAGVGVGSRIDEGRSALTLSQGISGVPLPEKDVAALRSGLPPGTRAALERERGPGGSQARLLALLRQADRQLVRQINDAKNSSGRTKQEVSEAIASLRSDRTSIADEIAALLKADPVKEQPIIPLALQVSFAKAQLTKRTSDDLEELRKIERVLEQRIKTETDLNRQAQQLVALRNTRDQIAGLARKGADLSFDNLFGGPVLSSPEFQFAKQFGFKPRPKDLVADIKAQLADQRTFLADIEKLKRQGAPAELVQEFLQRGATSGAELHALAAGPKGIRQQYFGQFEKLGQQTQRIERMEVAATDVVINAGSVTMGGGYAGGGQPSGNPMHRGKFDVSWRGGR